MTARQVLVIEDDGVAQLLLKKHLTKMGFSTVDIVDNGEDALVHAQEKSYDLCLVDIWIKGDMDGISTVKKMHDIQEMPIIYLTASSDKETFSRALETKHFGFMVKPYDKSSLQENIERALTAQSQVKSLKDNETEQLLDLIFESANVGIYVTDRSGKMIKVNKAYCKRYGYSESELIGFYFTKVLPPRMRAKADDLHHRYISGETEEGAGEWQVQCKDGTIKDTYVTAARMETKDGRVFKITTVTDITEKKRYTRQLERTIQEKEQLIREVHHRVKNNLNVVSGLLALQAEKVEDDPKIHRLFVESINRIKTLSIVHEKLYKKENLAFIAFDQYVENLAQSLFDTYLESGKKVGLKLELDPLELNLDQAISAGLIINEVISNSLKYAFPNGNEGLVQISLASHDDAIKVGVKDNGIGLPPNFKAENSASLGMQLVYTLAKQLDASIKVESKDGVSVLLEFIRHD
ncbi:MAG: histidine kinase dimerization/phosphoacceptor domain -containing protein [Flammeovirgaceae bacterium]